MKDGITLGNDAEASKALVKLMKDSEEEYQNGISENYQVTRVRQFMQVCLRWIFYTIKVSVLFSILQTMSDTTFKALRRALPVTKTKVGTFAKL